MYLLSQNTKINLSTSWIIVKTLIQKAMLIHSEGRAGFLVFDLNSRTSDFKIGSREESEVVGFFLFSQ